MNVGRIQDGERCPDCAKIRILT